jgi:hypothetical protein
MVSGIIKQLSAGDQAVHVAVLSFKNIFSGFNKKQVIQLSKWQCFLNRF